MGPRGRIEWIVACLCVHNKECIHGMDNGTDIQTQRCVCKHADIVGLHIFTCMGNKRGSHTNLFQVALAPALLCWVPLSLLHSSGSPPAIPPLSPPPGVFTCDRSVRLENELLNNLRLLCSLLKTQKTYGGKNEYKIQPIVKYYWSHMTAKKPVTSYN